MGRYATTGTAPANATKTVVTSECYHQDTHKYAFDANSDFQNRVILDSPGNYTFQVPDGVTCLRTIAVGGGGKSKCTQTCCGYAGAGGGYSEKWDTVAGTTTVTVVVGRQEQDTTISYTNAAVQSIALTAGGAGGCNIGTASGGDWNSNGGIAGKNCNYCGGSYSHYCGSCVCQYSTTCCGYCVVWTGISARQMDPSHDSNGCCQGKYAGGGSAGSWIHSTGGAGQNAYNNTNATAQSGPAGGGGGGIGYINREAAISWSCNCICMKQGYNGQCYGNKQRDACNLPSAGGGGGTAYQCCQNCAGHNIQGCCMHGRWRNGHGGWGGAHNNEGRGKEMFWGMSEAPNGHGDSYFTDIDQGPAPVKYDWHDIHEMCGSGSSGRAMMFRCRAEGGNWTGRAMDGNPDNAGEGAGTGAVVYNCCDVHSTYNNCCLSGADACGTLNWNLICALGTGGHVCCADKMMETIAPYTLACAGTLGGAGGTGICHFTQFAGKGGGAGVSRSAIMCICHGGNYDYCNNNSGNPLLAFPPAELDWRVSNAGTGMAIIYWKNA